MDNSLGFRAEATLNFINILKKIKLKISKIICDERLSTIGAEEYY